MSLGKVSIIIEAAMARFESDMGRASRLMEKESKRWQKQLDDYEKKAKVAGAAVGAAIASGLTTAGYAIKRAIDRMDELSKAAQRAQMPTEEFSQLTYAGNLADVAMDDLVKSMGRLARAQADAAGGAKTQVEIFDRLGIAFKNNDGTLRSSREVFLDFADVYEKFKGSPEILAAGMQIFGRSFQSLIPLLKDGRDGLEAAAEEADRLGFTITDQAGQAAEEFNDNLTRLQTAAMGLANAVAAELLPDLVRLSGEFVDSAKEGDRLRETARTIADAITGTATTVLNLVDRLAILRAEMGRLELSAQQFTPAAGIRSLIDGGSYMAPYEANVKRMQELANDAAAARARIEGRNAPAMLKPVFAGEGPEPAGLFRRPAPVLAEPIAVPEKSGGGRKSGKSEEERAAEQLQRRYESLLAQQQERIALYGQEGEAARVRYEIERGELSALDAAKAEQLIRDAEHIDLLDQIAEHEQLVADIAREHAEEQKRLTERRQDVLDTIRDEIKLVGMSAAQQEIWNNLKWAGVDAESEWGRQIVATTEELQRQRDAMDAQIEAMDGVRSATSGLFEDLMSGTKSFKDAFTDAMNSIVEQINRIVAQQLTESLFGKQGDPGGGSSGGWLGQLFGSFFGGGGSGATGGASGGGFWANLIGSFFGGGRATGGPTRRGMFYEVNERGPELYSTGGRTFLMSGDRDGAVMPMTAAAAGGGFNPTMNFNFAAPTSTKTQTQMAARAGYELRRAQRLGA